MNGQRSHENVFALEKNGTINMTSFTTLHSGQRIVQKFVLVWVDPNIDQPNKDCQNTLAQLQTIGNDVNIYTQPDQCIQFLNNINNEKAFVIVSGGLGQYLVPKIHDMPQVDAIYIFCGNKSRHEEWTKEWNKIKGVHTEIKSICQALQLAVKQFNEDSIAISIVSLDEGAFSQNLDQLEPSFMYTQIFKEILLEMETNPQAITNLATYCRNLYKGNKRELQIISEFEYDYRPQLSIWWYTRECFTYQMLNRALRNLEADIIINMGFFIRDLHRQIQELHRKQISNYHGKPFVVYRGQGLSTTDLEKLQKRKGGLISFNSFLSTSKKREVPLDFAKYAVGKTNMAGILFKMIIDPSISATPFAGIEEVSYFKTEEILFSMHTVFRIGEIIPIDKNNSLYEVQLKLTVDDDEQLRTLTNRIRKETEGATGWGRMGNLLLKIGQYDKAEELYKVQLEQTSDKVEKAHYYNQLGYIKDHQGDYNKAIWYYKQGLEIYQKMLPPNHPSLATSYNNIGGVYKSMGEYSEALSFYEESLDIKQKTLPKNHPSLATSYNNIGAVYKNMGEYLKALSFYGKALEIFEKTLPSNHPSLATSYNNIGLVYKHIGEHSKALSFYEKDLAICQKTLPSNHPSMATSYNNIAGVYYNLKQYSKALSYFERALDIRQRSLPPNHPNIQDVRKSIEIVKESIQ